MWISDGFIPHDSDCRIGGHKVNKLLILIVIEDVSLLCLPKSGKI
jgi:hypothetical protein